MNQFTSEGKKRIKINLLYLSMVFALVLAGCGGTTGETEQEISSENSEDVPKVSQDLFAMDTYMTVTAYGSNAQDAVDKAAEEIQRLDELLSTGNSSSEVYQVNQNGGGILSEDVAYLLERSMELYESTNGAFDIAVYPVMKAWGFTDGNYRVPSQDELETLLQLTDAEQIHYDKEAQKVSFDMEGMQMDLGGIAKGYTSGRIMDIFRECGVQSGLVNLGGNVQVLGAKPDGSSWQVGIQDPDDAESSIGVAAVQDRTVITSGAYERYFEEDGVTYHHIIDPETGYPADNGLVSVSIISADGTLADGLSTSFYIMGLDQTAEYWKAHSGEFDMVLMTDDRQLYVTEGIADDFRSDYEITVITGDESK